MRMNGKNIPAWAHPGRGSYRRADGKGVVTQVGSHDWKAFADVGTGMHDIGICHSGQEARGYVDDILSKGELPLPPKPIVGTFSERAMEKIQRAMEKIRRGGLGATIFMRAYTDVEVTEDFTTAREGVLLGTADEPVIALVVNGWGMKEGQQSYQVLAFPSRRILSDHDDMAWRYPQLGERALDDAIAATVKALFMRNLNDGDDDDDGDDDFE